MRPVGTKQLVTSPNFQLIQSTPCYKPFTHESLRGRCRRAETAVPPVPPSHAGDESPSIFAGVGVSSSCIMHGIDSRRLGRQSSSVSGAGVTAHWRDDNLILLFLNQQDLSPERRAHRNCSELLGTNGHWANRVWTWRRADSDRRQ